MRRGEVWLLNLDPTVGAEIRKTRPAIIVNDEFLGLHKPFCRREGGASPSRRAAGAAGPLFPPAPSPSIKSGIDRNPEATLNS